MEPIGTSKAAAGPTAAVTDFPNVWRSPEAGAQLTDRSLQGRALTLIPYPGLKATSRNAVRKSIKNSNTNTYNTPSSFDSFFSRFCFNFFFIQIAWFPICVQIWLKKKFNLIVFLVCFVWIATSKNSVPRVYHWVLGNYVNSKIV